MSEEDGPVSVRYFCTVETVFCDNEQDRNVRLRFLRRWMLSLQALAMLDIPHDMRVFFLLYLSRDKVEERSALESFLGALHPDVRRRFVVVEYSHPVGGYDIDAAKHPDLVKNPNKIAPRRDALFAEALRKIEEVTGSNSLDSAERVIRASLDDDDFWLPWQLSEIRHVAETVYRPGVVQGVGLRQAVVAYFDDKRADVVELTHHMNGNKFYLSGVQEWTRQQTMSPWSIPERFDEQNVQRMLRAGVELVSVGSNTPGWIYGRWGGNLSLHDKSRYYREINSSISLTEPERLVLETYHHLVQGIQDNEGKKVVDAS